MLSGRYADVLSGLFLGYSTLWYTSHHKNVKGLDKVTDFAMQVKHKSEGGTCCRRAFFLFLGGLCVRCNQQTSPATAHVLKRVARRVLTEACCRLFHIFYND